MALAVAQLVVVAPIAMFGALGVLALAISVYLHPRVGAYVLIGTTPLLAGMDRGLILPVVRPHEAVALVIMATLILRAVVRLRSGGLPSIHIGNVDASILAMAVLSSAVPILWMMVRGKGIILDDVLYALSIWKFYAIYLLVRSSIRTEEQVRRCLVISMAVASVVAVVAILQSLQLFGMPTLLATYYAPFGDAQALDNNRGTSTLASSIAVGDLLTFNFAIAVGWFIRQRDGMLPSIAPSVVMGGSLLFMFGILASGQFSGVIALLVGGLAVLLVTKRMRHAFTFLPFAFVGGVVLEPVISRRLEGFNSAAGLPPSWLGRLDNLRTFFWPELAADFNYVLGVRPSARIPAPEAWRDYVWIESGHTWLLWNGGIPLFLAFFLFLWIAIRATARVARERSDAIGVAGIASFASLVVLAVLMTLDVHLTLRGSADLLFALLALALTGRHASALPPAATDPARH